MKTSDIATLAIGAGALYLLYRALNGASTAVQNATAALVNPVADAYVNLTSGGAMQTTGSVILPNGSIIPTSQVALTAAGSNSAQFTYGGQVFYINQGADSNGNYQASYSLTS